MLSHLTNARKWRYAIAGLTGRFGNKKRCPCCGSGLSKTLDRKFFHTMEECQACGILFRHPGEKPVDAIQFYQSDYAEPGLTTELPSEEVLQRLKSTNFKGSSKDFSYQIAVLKSLGLLAGMRVLDFGANWGYLTYQLRQAGFEADGFEISKPRADFASRLGVRVVTDLSQLQAGYDIAYSCHALEHVPDPLASIMEQFKLVRPGGMVVAHTPNGSLALRQNNPAAFHSVWGQVHPVLLTDRFIAGHFPDLPVFISSDDNPELLMKWDRQSRLIGDTSGSGLFFALVKPTEVPFPAS